MENTVNSENFKDNGTVNISDEVVAVMASLAATGVSGVAGMSGGVAGGIVELLGKKSLSKGVRIVKEADSVLLELSVIVEYGAKIPDVAWEIQDKVKTEIETMTGIAVSGVNVSVESINVPADETKKDEVSADTAESTETTEE